MSATSIIALRAKASPALAPLGLGIAVWALMFFVEIRAAVGVWQSSDTYGHCFLILPMAAYLAWDRRDALIGLMARPLPWLAVLALPIAIAWFVAERLGIMEGRQLVAMAALGLLVLAVLGWPIVRALLGPLLFLVFLVPFGAFITPALQDFTAAFTIGGLNLLGIANYATDLTIEISAGTFYVAEACAGLRFLIAAVAFGVFYALLNYRSPGRRAVFMVASVIVPIVANGFRALGIVVLGSILGSAQAAAADHVIYGWVFFSFVMLLLVAGGMPFREAPAGAAPPSATVTARPGGRASWAAAAAVLLLLAIGPGTALALAARVAPVRLTSLPALVPPALCDITPPPPALDDRVLLTIGCPPPIPPITVALQAFPRRSTADALARQRRIVTGEQSAEEATSTRLTGVLPGHGEWTVVQTIVPYRTTAFAVWTHGAPARGGLAGRAAQARDSLAGSAYAPVMITLRFDTPGRLAPAAQQQMEATLRAFVNGQPDLSARMAEVSQAVQ